MNGERGSWGGRFGLIFAAAGSSVGLGNVWRFPYLTGENGGGLFVLVYLVCIALVGIPIMVAELMVGRAAARQPVGAFAVIEGRPTAWTGVGWLGVVSGYVILSFYIVVGGWSLDYTLKSVVHFTGPIHANAEREAAKYRAMASLPELRQMLAERRTEHRAAEALGDIRRRAPKYVWTAYESFETAMEEAGGSEEARSRLLEQEGFREKVNEAQALTDEMAVVRRRIAREVEVHYAEMSPRAVRDEAQTAKRREVLAEGIEGAFDEFARDGWTVSFWAFLFLLICTVVVASGVASGIERACRLLLPMLVVLMLFMVGYGFFQSGFGEAVRFVFRPDATRLKASGFLEALGQAFFTLSLGMGAIITYGSYQRSKENMLRQSLMVAAIDTGVALLACLMIFPIIFTYGQRPAAGPGLVFTSMPLAFAEIGAGGMLLAILFFGLLFLAALTSAISLLEVVISYFIDQRGWKRSRATWLIGLVVFLFSLPCAFSLDPSFMMASWEPTYGRTFFDTMDYLASNWLLPLGGMFIAIYAGWVMPRKIIMLELENVGAAWVRGWLLLVRWVAPSLVVLVLLQRVGFIDVDELVHRLLH